MTGKEVLQKIKQFGYRNAEIASLLGITEQALNSKLKTSDIKVSFIQDLARVTNKSVYDWIDQGAVNIVTDPGIEYGNPWKDRYFQVLEKYNQCLEEKDQLHKENKSKVQFPDKPIDQ